MLVYLLFAFCVFTAAASPHDGPVEAKAPKLPPLTYEVPDDKPGRTEVEFSMIAKQFKVEVSDHNYVRRIHSLSDMGENPWKCFLGLPNGDKIEQHFQNPRRTEDGPIRDMEVVFLTFKGKFADAQSLMCMEENDNDVFEIYLEGKADHETAVGQCADGGLCKYIEESPVTNHEIRWYLNQPKDHDLFLNMHVVGEGWTADIKEDFFRHATEGLDHLFSRSPYKEYKDYFNIAMVYTEADSQELIHWQDKRASGGFIGLTRNTHWGTTFGCDTQNPTSLCSSPSVHQKRLHEYGLMSDASVLLAPKDPQGRWIRGLSIAGFVSAMSVQNDGDWKRTLVHESSHTLGKLGDEYVENDKCKQSKTSYFEANLDTESDISKVKWAHWADMPHIGVFEGGAYCGKGVYRPTEKSLMRGTDLELYEPHIEELIIQLSSYVDLIQSVSPVVPEQNLESDDCKDVYNSDSCKVMVERGNCVSSTWYAHRMCRATCGREICEIGKDCGKGCMPPLKTINLEDAMTFSVEHHQNTDGTVVASWALDGESIGTGASVTLDPSTLSHGGIRKLMLTVQETSPRVRQDKNNVLTETKVWYIDAPHLSDCPPSHPFAFDYYGTKDGCCSVKADKSCSASASPCPGSSCNDGPPPPTQSPTDPPPRQECTTVKIVTGDYYGRTTYCPDYNPSCTNTARPRAADGSTCTSSCRAWGSASYCFVGNYWSFCDVAQAHPCPSSEESALSVLTTPAAYDVLLYSFASFGLISVAYMALSLKKSEFTSIPEQEI